MRLRTTLFGCCAGALGLALAQPATAVINRTGQAFARYGSGSTTIASDSFPGGQLGANDTTGLHSTSNATIDVAAQGFTQESIGILSAMSGFDAASGHPDDPLNYFIASGGGITLVHTIDVTSSSLPQSTPVQIRFGLATAFDAGALHSFGPGSQSNNAFASASVQANVTGQNNTFLSGNDNKLIKNTFDDTDLAVGLLAGSQATEFVIDSHVGGSITFALIIDTDANGDVAGVPSPLFNHSGQAWSSLAVAYGAEPANGEDLQLSVTGPAAAFPNLTQVSSAWALANLPSNPFAPPVALPGDLDGDGFVGIDDLNLILSNWNQNVPPANPLADPSGDGFVGIDDLNEVLGNWNAGTPPNAAALPEPASLGVCVLGSIAFMRRVR